MGGKYNYCIANQIFPDDKNSYGIHFVFVLVAQEEYKASIKRYLDGMGVISQFMLEEKIRYKSRDLSVMGNILKQVNAKMGGVNW